MFLSNSHSSLDQESVYSHSDINKILIRVVGHIEYENFHLVEILVVLPEDFNE